MSFTHEDDAARPGPDIDDRLAEQILRGRTTALADEHRAFADAVREIRREAVVARPRPSAELLRVFAEGIAGDQQAAPAGARRAAPTAPGASVAHSTPLRRRFARLATLSLAAKLALAGTAAAAAVAGAGAAGVLPGQPDDAGPPAEVDPGLQPGDDTDTSNGLEGPGTDDARQPSREQDVDPDDPPAEEADDRRGDDSHRRPDVADVRTERTPDSVPESADTGVEETEERTEERTDELDEPTEEHTDELDAPTDLPPESGAEPAGGDSEESDDRAPPSDPHRSQPSRAS